MTRRDDRDLRELLADLDETLGRLRTELDDGPRREGDERPTPRPPTVGELVRFTEEYTIPTTIAVLEASVAALELLQGLLRLASPDGRGRLADANDAALGGVEQTFSELRRTLREVDLPADPETRGVVTEARELTEAVERRIEESREDGASREERGRRERGVAIDVSEATEPDVESELRSLKDDLDQDAT
ncbi:MAG: hypothetical protein V5A31_04060 [Haloferacaceae archaeon]|jgi:hypothetical protein